ncbi:AAEL002452-PA [Aedes aegypti]|uniref:AAEL002452-PA n=1 Tax=Aedes aegypti TaxID=7159 RepID=Q17I60_AEDAE|nr:AAEL002452-PA [Aedes aegypti]
MVNTFSVVVILTLFALSIQTAPTGRAADSQLKVVTESNNYATDEFDWSYQLSDGREVRSNAYKKLLADGREVLVINGLYSYVAPNGVKYTVSYYSDENGYHPTVIVGDELLFPEGPQFIDPKVLASLIG